MDIIRLLPDSVANQIAAGEVIQRPASAVKELLENSIDAGADQVRLIIREAGKSLIQVIDNGSGMSENDARLSFERHATSKISSAEELFSISTKGFRGEALASIAAVAQVELISRKETDELGTKIEIEGSKIKTQESCTHARGTSISVKNLFYNIPARRNFLKANPVELKHILEEFYRIALSHPEVGFSLFVNDEQMHLLEKTNFKQRIVAISGNSYREKLVPIMESTETVEISGFILKPEYSRKTRGEQYFFVNGRFIKSSYLHYAVVHGYSEILPSDAHPSYYLNIKVPPATIDINIHPTKTEIKFENEKMIFAILRSAVKKAIGINQLAPSLDFTQENILNFSYKPSNRDGIIEPPISTNKDFNPFSNEINYKRPDVKQDWEKLFNDLELKKEQRSFVEEIVAIQPDEILPELNLKTDHIYFQLHGKYILTPIRSGFLVMDQSRAHQRILYEKFLKLGIEINIASQQQLFPQTFDLAPLDYQAFKEIKPYLNQSGYEAEEFGNQTIIVRAIPVDHDGTNIGTRIEEMIHSFHETEDHKINARERFALAMSKSECIKYGRVLSLLEMNNLADELFACEKPYFSPSGSPSVITITLSELEKRFR